MANKRLNDLPIETDPAADDYYAVDGTTTRRVTRANTLKENLEAIRALTSAADKGIQFTGAGTAATYDLTSAGKALLDDADAAAQRTTLGLGDLAIKDTIAVPADITASGAPSETTFLRGDGAWAAPAGSGDMLSANNLSDVASVATSRVNLGFPSMSVSDYHSTLAVNSAGTAFQIMKRTLLLPDDFGWTSGGSLAARHAAMVAWAADAGPGTLDRNTDYEIDLATGSLLVAAGKVIEGNNALIYDTTNVGLMLDLIPGAADADGVLAGGWKIADLRLRGSGNTVANVSGIGLRVMGVDNIATAAAPDFVYGPLLDNVIIEEIAGYGVWDQFTIGTRVANPKIRNIGYAGYGMHSSVDFRMHRHTIENIGPGISSSMYGFYASRREEGDRLTDFTASPRPQDFDVSHGCVTGSGYSAIDTHGGIDGKFNFNTIRDCLKGINIGAGSTAFAGNVGALNCQAIGNILYGLVDSQDTSPAIYVVGGSSDGTTSIATDGWTRNAVVEGNQIYGWGNPSTHDMGGIMLQGTHNAKVRGNLIEHCARWGVCARYQNYGFDISGNSVTDSFADAAYGGGIGATSLNNVGRIGGNTLRTDGGAGTIVMNAGVYLEDLASITADLAGDTFYGSVATHYFKGASAVMASKPVRQSGKQTVTVAAGAAAGTATFSFPTAFSAAPVITLSGPSYFDTNEVIYGFTSLSATQVTLTARTVDGTTIGATGGSIEVHWVAEGY